MSAFEEIPEEPEHVPGRPIYRLLVATILVIAACGVVVWTLHAFQLAGGGRSDVRPAMRLEQIPPAQPFSAPMQMEGARAAARYELEHWTWADRTRGRVLVPVDVAIDRYLARRGAR